MKGAPRKLRKSCSLPTCSKTPGECMHCTCDGRCGQHDAGRCGVRREGNGKSCKRDGCAKDATCLHSTRATCCHCRNLVSSSNRSSRKRTRADVESEREREMTVTVLPLAVSLAMPDEEDETQDESETDAPDDLTLDTSPDEMKKMTDEETDGQSSPTSCDGLLPLSADLFGEFEICDDLLVIIKKPRIDAPVPAFVPSPVLAVCPPPHAVSCVPVPASVASTVSPKSLAEYEQYASRRSASNLVVIVEGTQFNLHKHPMLLESQLLNAKARESLLTSQSPVPVVQLASFPGGAAAFEQICVYAYTGELHFSADSAAALYCAIHHMNMGPAATTEARHYLSSVTQPGGSIDTLLRVTQDASVLMEKHDALSICAELHLECVDALALVLPLELTVIQQLLAFPIQLFLQVTQEMLAARGPQELAVDMVRQLCVQAELAQVHRDATEQKDVTASQRCLALLEQTLGCPSVRGSSSNDQGGLKGGAREGTANTQEEDDDALFMRMMCDFEMDPTSDDDANTGAFTDALSAAALEPFAFASRGVGRHRGAFAAAAFAV